MKRVRTSSSSSSEQQQRASAARARLPPPSHRMGSLAAQLGTMVAIEPQYNSFLEMVDSPTIHPRVNGPIPTLLLSNDPVHTNEETAEKLMLADGDEILGESPLRLPSPIRVHTHSELSALFEAKAVIPAAAPAAALAITPSNLGALLPIHRFVRAKLPPGYNADLFPVRFHWRVSDSLPRGQSLEWARDVGNAIIEACTQCIPDWGPRMRENRLQAESLRPTSWGQIFLRDCSDLDLQCLRGYLCWKSVVDHSPDVGEGNDKPQNVKSVITRLDRYKDYINMFHSSRHISDVVFFYQHAYTPSFATFTGTKRGKQTRIYERTSGRSAKKCVINRSGKKVYTLRRCFEKKADESHPVFHAVVRAISQVDRLVLLLRSVSRVDAQEPAAPPAQGRRISFYLRKFTPMEIVRIFPLSPVGSRFCIGVHEYRNAPQMRQQYDDEFLLHPNIRPSKMSYGSSSDTQESRAYASSVTWEQHLHTVYRTVNASAEERRLHPLYLVADALDAFENMNRGLTDGERKRLPIRMCRGGDPVCRFDAHRGGDLGAIRQCVYDYRVRVVRGADETQARADLQELYALSMRKQYNRVAVVNIEPVRSSYAPGQLESVGR